MRVREIGSRLPVPLGEILMFAATVAGFLALWRLFSGPVDDRALSGAVGCAVVLGWVDSYRRERARTSSKAGTSA